MIKAIFFDIDNTLFSHTTHHIPESTRTAIHALKQKGILLFTATGRPLSGMLSLIADLPFDGYITLNGQICLDKEKHLIYDAPIPQPDADYMVSAFTRKEIQATIIERDNIYSNFTKQSFIREVNAPVPPMGDYMGGTIYQLIVFGDDDAFRALMGHLPGCKMTRWNSYGADIISKDGGKVVGIRHFLEHFHLRQDEIMAFGDAENDMDMLQFSGVGIAMGNADDTVKQQADYVTEDIDRDGIDLALRQYGLL